VFTVGFTVIHDNDEPPGNHPYCVPGALLVTQSWEEVPEHTEGGVAVAVNTGLGYTVTVVVQELVQPLKLEPDTV